MKNCLILLFLTIILSCHRTEQVNTPPPSIKVTVEDTSLIENYLNKLNPSSNISVQYEDNELTLIHHLDYSQNPEEILYFWQQAAFEGLDTFGENTRLSITVMDNKSLFTVHFVLANTKAYQEGEISFRQYLGTTNVELLVSGDELPVAAVSLLAYLAGARDGRFDTSPVNSPEENEDSFHWVEDELVESTKIYPLNVGENGPYSSPQNNDYYVYQPTEDSPFIFSIPDNVYYFRVLNEDMSVIASADEKGQINMVLKAHTPYFIEVFSNRQKKQSYKLVIKKGE
ncbi:hypothetical protein [Spirochaeta cellobiosiphila]|uniref:hypothetical protein n=1 Tax=Spirochaeta cellobiosiphila TaxID=504483 RepID=UPI00041B7943|nr:hypothetical protein [Spirochaeta cellobiosiphila]